MSHPVITNLVRVFVLMTSWFISYMDHVDSKTSSPALKNRNILLTLQRIHLSSKHVCSGEGFMANMTFLLNCLEVFYNSSHLLVLCLLLFYYNQFLAKYSIPVETFCSFVKHSPLPDRLYKCVGNYGSYCHFTFAIFSKEGVTFCIYILMLKSLSCSQFILLLLFIDCTQKKLYYVLDIKLASILFALRQNVAIVKLFKVRHHIHYAIMQQKLKFIFYFQM